MKFQVNQLMLFMTAVWTFPPRNWGGFVFLAQERGNHQRQNSPVNPVGFALGSTKRWGAEKLSSGGFHHEARIGHRGRLIRFGHVHMTSVKTMLIIELG